MSKLLDHISRPTFFQVNQVGKRNVRDSFPQRTLLRATRFLGSQTTPKYDSDKYPKPNKQLGKWHAYRSFARRESTHSLLCFGGSSAQHPNSNLAVTATLPVHFAESVRLARNSQHSDQPASESQFRATRMLQVAAGVANCNTYNRNQSVRELRKGLFFRGRRHGAGIDSTSESFRTAFQTIYDLTGNHAAEDCRMHAIQTSDNPRHAPSVQC
jgi:hypothetical protein